MTERSVSSREFELDPNGVKRAAVEGPVLVIDRGEVSHVLLVIADYRRLIGERRSIVEALGMLEDIEFEPPRMDVVIRPADLS